MGFKNKDSVDIKDIWSQEIASYLGMLIHGFPNAFMVYSPQGTHMHPEHIRYCIAHTRSSTDRIL
jgi:hypothetical protein